MGITLWALLKSIYMIHVLVAYQKYHMGIVSSGHSTGPRIMIPSMIIRSLCKCFHFGNSMQLRPFAAHLVRSTGGDEPSEAPQLASGINITNSADAR